MHGSAETAVEARGAGKYLGKRAVKQKVYRKVLDVALLLLALFDNAQDISAQKLFHDIVKLGIIQLIDGGKTFGENFAVAAVRAEGKVVDVKAVCLTDCACFLTDGKVRGAGVVIFNAVV